MNIGLVLSKTPNYSETFFVSKLNGLKLSGFDVKVFAQYKDPSFSICEVKLAPSVPYFKGFQFLKLCLVLLGILIRFPIRFFSFIRYERQARRPLVQIAKNLYTNSHILTADLDWLHFGFATIALQSEHVAKAIGAKMAVSFRGFDLDVYPLHHPKCYDLLFEQVDQVHAISHYMLKQSYALGLSTTKPFTIITPAINTQLFTNEIQPFKNIQHFLTVARLHPIKGLEDTIHAMALLKAEGVDFRYSIIGEGPILKELETLITRLNLSEHVFLVGKKSHDEVIEHMKHAQLYIQYSVSEGFCNAVLEAQAMGLLCITSDGGALPENVIHGKTGWIVKKQDPSQLTKAILEVLKLSEIEQFKLRTQAQQRIQSEFNLEHQRKEFVDFYKQTPKDA